MNLADLNDILSVNPELRHELDRNARLGLAALEVPSPLRLSTWMEQNFYLSEESSYEKGAWVFYPFQVAIADCIGHDGIAKVSWRKSARTGYTKIFLGAICYFAEHKHRNQVVYQPTDEDRDDFTTTELEPALRDVKAMRRVFPKMHRKSKDNTMKKKRFIGCLLHLRGAKAAKNFRRLTVDNVFYDETDGMDRDIEREGSPFRLGDKRIEGATFPKSVAGSTPKLRGMSLIEDREAEADQRFEYYIRCPHCSDEHTLKWGGEKAGSGLKWRNNDPDTAAHVCPHCGVWISQSEYLAAWNGRWKTSGGMWIDESNAESLVFRNADDIEVPAPNHVAFFTWTAYSPQAAWSNIVGESIAAKRKLKGGDDSDWKTFVNTTLGETYAVEGAKTNWEILRQRAEAFPLRLVPLGGLILVAGIDVQDNRFEIVIWAFGRYEETWTVDYRVMYCDPGSGKAWADLDTYLSTRFPHAGGQYLAIDAVAIDTGGHYTHQVYHYAMHRESKRVHAVAGDSRTGKPIPIVAGAPRRMDVNANGELLKSGVKLWGVGTNAAKDLLFNRLQIRQPGPGYVHLSADLPDEFFKGLTAEERVEQKTARGSEHRWVKPNSAVRNEPLDCTVYAYFCAGRMKLSQYTDAEWARRESVVMPLTADMFVQTTPVAPLPLEISVQPAVHSADTSHAEDESPVVQFPLPAPTFGGRRVRGRGIA